MSKTESVVTKYGKNCFYCGVPCNTEHHLLFGLGMRSKAEEDGIKLPACDKHHVIGSVFERVHDNPMSECLSKIAGQLAWEKHCIAEIGCSEDEARERFRKRYGESFL